MEIYGSLSASGGRKVHVLFCPACNMTYKLLHCDETDRACDVCREQGGAEENQEVGRKIAEMDAGPLSKNHPLRLGSHPSEGRVYPPPPCSGATCPREVLVQQPCPSMAPCDRGGSAKVCPIKKERTSRPPGEHAIPVLHELTQQNPNHLEGPVFLAEKLVFFQNEVEETCEPIEVACETTSIHWPLNFNEYSQTDPIEIYPLCPATDGCLTEFIVQTEVCTNEPDPLLGPQLTMEECVSPTCELIEVARECTSVHRPPFTNSGAQTDPVRTVPIVNATECTDIVTGIERERMDETHDRVIVHTDRVCYDKDQGCERLLSKDGEIIIRPPQEVARVALPDKILIEERNRDEQGSSSSSGNTRDRRASVESAQSAFKAKGSNLASRNKSPKSRSKLSTRSNSPVSRDSNEERPLQSRRRSTSRRNSVDGSHSSKQSRPDQI